MPRTGETIGPYTLVTKLGSGGFGVVWLAERRTAITTTRVALKCPLGDDVDMDAIRHEADLWVQVSGHPNVVPIIEANIYDEQVVIVSEYAPGGTLAAKLAELRGTRMPIGTAVEMVMGILTGLEHLHSRNIIHRDLKPANILLQGNTPRLADFGISRVLKTTSQSSTVAGTPVYMAPEAFNGVRSAQTDIWAVGVMLYEMLAGQLPYPPSDYTTLVAAIITRDPAPLPEGIPDSLRYVVARALSKDAKTRFGSAAEMRAALRDAMQGPQTQASQKTQSIAAATTIADKTPPATAKTQPAPSSGIPAHYVYAAAAVLIVALILGFLFLRQQPSTGTQTFVVASSPTVAPSATPSPTASVAAPTPAPTLSAFAAAEARILTGDAIVDSDLIGLSLDELRRLRNTVYARHGKPFQTPEMQAYFNSRPWYRIRAGYDNADLTATDLGNAALIQNAEK
jgi:serine/threonine-protein kinase